MEPRLFERTTIEKGVRITKQMQRLTGRDRLVRYALEEHRSRIPIGLDRRRCDARRRARRYRDGRGGIRGLRSAMQFSPLAHP